MKQTLINLLFLLTLLSCGSNSNKRKELELKEKELELKEKELQLKEKGLTKDSNSKIDQPVSKIILEYNFEGHNDIKVFMKDLSEAITKNDKSAVTKMTNYPFRDGWPEYASGAFPFSNVNLYCKDSNELLTKYSKLFSSSIANAIKNRKYRGHQKRSKEEEDAVGPDDVSPGDFLIYINIDLDKPPPYGLYIKKVNGVYKLYETYVPRD